jgi:DNA-binding MarR family transcriptional regulator
MEIPDKPVSEILLDLISRQDGKLDWIGIAASIGANTPAERSQIFTEMRTLERRGLVRRQHGEADARYWIA